MFADHLASSSSVKVLPAPDPHIHVTEHESSMPKKKIADEVEEQDLDFTSQTISAQSSSGESMGESDTGTTSDTERK